MNAQHRCGMVPTLILGLVTALAGRSETALAQGTAEPARAVLAAWDTGTSALEPLAADAIERKTGWKAIASGEPLAAFQGDVVIANGRLLAVARKQGTGVELYSLAMGKPIFRT